ncbi:response regulator [Pseudoxanthomonas dokdonensis]|uniref:Response regulatory domain-containing protein n=1 Tax=Pseudoxanthomonas dokdonensis TaxID=344882 RepID=A0A0R0CS48_9GAMM|nr:response regulator [Pseudoxanthomonas dokdonensis]KRG68035.1 hypothetical protein ABB29_14770 [Pseudoxanthomonas dokdonensis]
MKRNDGGQAGPLDGLSVLLIEDDPLLSDMVADLLQDQGARQVTTASSVAAALKMLAGSSACDVAAVDVHLGGEAAWPLLERLAQLQVPHFIMTGYDIGEIPAAFGHVPVVRKPYQLHNLVSALAAASVVS